MGHRRHDRRGARQVVPGGEADAVFVLGLGRFGHRVVHDHVAAVALQFADHVDHLAVAQIGAVFLEGEAQHDDVGALDVVAALDHLLDGLFGDVLAHAVVDATAGQDDLRVVAQHVGLVGEVVRIDADAVAAHQARTEGQEVPLGARSFEHFDGVDADLVEDHREFVHQRDVEVALGVFDDLGGFGHLDRAGRVDAGGDHGAVNLFNLLEGFRGVAGDDLHDLGDGAFLVARVDALGGVADVEVLLPLEAREFLEDGNADFFGGTGIHGGFVHDDGAALEVLADAFGRFDQRGEIRLVGFVHRGGHGDDDEVGFADDLRVGAAGEVHGGLEVCGAHFAGRIHVAGVGVDFLLVEVKTDGLHFFAELDGEGQAYVAEADYCDGGHLLGTSFLRNLSLPGSGGPARPRCVQQPCRPTGPGDGPACPRRRGPWRPPHGCERGLCQPARCCLHQWSPGARCSRAKLSKARQERWSLPASRRCRS